MHIVPQYFFKCYSVHFSFRKLKSPRTVFSKYRTHAYIGARDFSSSSLCTRSHPLTHAPCTRTIARAFTHGSSEERWSSAASVAGLLMLLHQSCAFSQSVTDAFSLPLSRTYRVHLYMHIYHYIYLPVLRGMPELQVRGARLLFRQSQQTWTENEQIV